MYVFGTFVCVCLLLGIVELMGILPPSYTPSSILFLFGNRVSLSCGGPHYIAEAGFEPVILLSQLPKYWDYRHAPPLLALFLFFKKSKNIKPGTVAHACNPSTWETDTGGSQVRDQPQQLSETVSNLARPFPNRE